MMALDRALRATRSSDYHMYSNIFLCPIYPKKKYAVCTKIYVTTSRVHTPRGVSFGTRSRTIMLLLALTFQHSTISSNFHYSTIHKYQSTKNSLFGKSFCEISVLAKRTSRKTSFRLFDNRFFSLGTLSTKSVENTPLLRK